MKFYKQNGFNLLELMLALIVVTSILLLAGHYYQVAKENTKVSQAAHLINQLVDASFKYFEINLNQIPRDLLPALVQMDLLPKAFENRKFSPWLTHVSILYLNVSRMPVLNIVMENIPATACYNLTNLMQLAGSSSKVGENSYLFSCMQTLHNQAALRDFKGEFGLAGIVAQ